MQIEFVLEIVNEEIHSFFPRDSIQNLVVVALK